jgi:hypothetical protein
MSSMKHSSLGPMCNKRSLYGLCNTQTGLISIEFIITIYKFVGVSSSGRIVPVTSLPIPR